MSCAAPPAGHEIREHFVVARLRQRYVERPRAVGLLHGMDVLEVLHVLPDHEQVILPLVNGLELRDSLVGIGLEHAEAPTRGLACPHHCRRGGQLQPIVADVEWGGLHQRHAAPRTGAGNVAGVVRVHRADESSQRGGFAARRREPGPGAPLCRASTPRATENAASMSPLELTARTHLAPKLSCIDDHPRIAQAGNVVFVRTLSLSSRLAADSWRRPSHGSNTPVVTPTTRTRGRKSRRRIAPPTFLLRGAVGLAHACAHQRN